MVVKVEHHQPRMVARYAFDVCEIVYRSQALADLPERILFNGRSGIIGVVDLYNDLWNLW
jgi:hypothetical protein